MNVVTLVGRLTANPDIRFASSTGKTVASFTLAVDRGLSREKRQEYEESGRQTADFIRVTFFGKLAEVIAEYFYKGRRIALQGELRTGKYTTSEGITRYTTEVWGRNFEFIDSTEEEKLSGYSYRGQDINNSRNRNEDVIEDFTPCYDNIPF